MTKKWLWYVCIGLICCSSIAFVYAKQTAGTSKARTDRNALIEQYEAVVAQIKANGETPELMLLETKLRAKLYPESRTPVNNATIEKLRTGVNEIEKVERNNAPTPTNYAGAPDQLAVAKAAYERMLNDEMLPGDKALIEASFPQTPAEPMREEAGSLDDNGGVWFNWTGSAGTGDNTCPNPPNPAPLTVSGVPTSLLDVEVKVVNLSHTWDSDVEIFLQGPNGVIVELSTDNGSSSDNYVNTVFDDEATTLITAGAAPFTGNFRPEGLLSTYDGINPNGTWTLRVCDDEGGITGTLTAWSIQILAQNIAGPELMVSALSPCGNQEPNGAATVSLRVTNNGQADAAATTAHFDFDGGATTDAFAVPLLGPSSFFDVFFTVPVNLTVGAHTLQGYVDAVAGDATQTNDTSSCNLNVFNCFDYTITNTGTVSGTTDGAGDNCALRTGQDLMIKWVVTTAGQYTISFCNPGNGWDSYMYLTTACCGGTTLATADEGCGDGVSFGNPVITCRTMDVGTYYIDYEPYSSGSTGPMVCTITLCAPCDVLCDPGDTGENAPTEVADSTFMVDQDPNGGCNNNLGPLWGSITCDETICGNNFVWTAPGGTGYRDLDWYYFELTEWDTVTLTCTAEYDALFGIYDDVETCVSGLFVISATTTAQCTTRTVKTCLAPGAYAAIVGPNFFGTGLDYVAGNSNYRLTMSCEPCTPATGRCCYVFEGAGACAINNSLECANLGGVWTTGITDCDGANACPTGRCCYLDVNNMPACLIDQQAICTSLGGTWTSGITSCETSPCTIARCCYNDGAACENTTLERCNFLAGSWTSGTTCELTPCPVPPTNDDCQTATAVVIPEWCSTAGSFVQLDLADTTCPETTTGDGVTIPEYTSTAGDEFFSFTLTECRRIAIVASGPDANNTGHDSHISVKDACCGATFILGNDDYGSNDSLPVYTTQGWLPATTRPSNSWGSMVAGRLPAGTYYVRAGAYSATSVCNYTLTFYDYGPCVDPVLCQPGDVISNLTVHRDSLVTPPGSEAFVTLRWTNTNAGDYNVWSSTNPNNTGWDAGTWTLETLTPLSLPSGAITWDRAPGFESYINFVVVPDCDPTPQPGRCCYVDGGNYACANTTEADCDLLGGDWTIYLNCECATNPCPQDGRCCYLDVNNQGACTDNLQTECATLNGVWTAGATCATDPCELGRCCYLDINNQGACADVQELECNFLGGTWTAGVTCAGEPCVTAACCYNAGASCSDLQDIECDFIGGTWYSGELCATFTCPVPPSNDDCGNAITITNGVPVSGDNTLANGVDPTSCGFNSDLDVWYVYTPTALTAITVTTCDPTWDLDTNISLWDLCTGGTELACDEDDFNANCTEWIYQSWLTYTPTTLDPIYIRIAGYNGDEGTFVLSVTQ